MSARTMTARYARALHDVVLDQGGVEQAERDLDAFAALVAAHADLHGVLINPAIPVAAKRDLVAALAARLSTSAPVTNLLRMLADRNRLAMVGNLAEAYRARRREHEGVIEAEITTAEAIDDARVAELRDRLAAATGRRVVMTARTDASLIGGAVARVGSTVYDSSVATQLQKIKTRLGA